MNESKDIDIERFKILASGFVVGNLSPEESSEFHQLVAKYPEAVTEIEELQEVLRQVLDAFTEVETPSQLLPAILEQAESSNNKVTSRRSLLRPWGRIAGGFGAALIIALGVDNYFLRRNLNLLTVDNNNLHQELTQIQAVNNLLKQPGNRLLSFQGVKAKANISGSIMLNSQQEKAFMVVQNLPPPPPGRMYLLWAVVADKKVFCGEVQPQNWGNSTTEIPFTAEMRRDFYHPQFSGLVVTLESDRNTPVPKGPMVMESSQI